MKKNRKIYIETYGCQMNFSDSEIVASILSAEGFVSTQEIAEADFIFLNTCSIRENAEDRVLKRLAHLRSMKRKKPSLRIGLLGCMAERLKENLLTLENSIDIIAGPDSYRDLPKLLRATGSGIAAINTILSEDETYADIVPVRYDSNGVSAFISIMRGCENYCAYCVVPYVRGQERSRDPHSVVSEAWELFNQGYREVTLLGQNVNSYFFKDGNATVDFALLLRMVASISPQLRVRFATSHPKDISDELLETIADLPNICRAIHLPVQSGSTAVLLKMNRGYTREHYMERIKAIRRMIPGCAISTDIITGFCDETEEDHLQTLSLMEWAGFDTAFMFRYSERPDTLAASQYQDNVPEEVKKRRLDEVIGLQNRLSLLSNKRDIGSVFEVMIEGLSKRSDNQYYGRNSQNKVVVFPKNDRVPGEVVPVKIERVTSATLIGTPVEDKYRI